MPGNLLGWWHLLSLDAPTVAALWSWSFARAVHIPLPWFSALLLATGTWLVYVADRILDGLPAGKDGLRERHHFYARNRLPFLGFAVAAGLFLLWLIFTRMTPAARREDTALFAVALIYFLLVHKAGARVERRLPKELAVGVLFAGATAVPAWSRMTSGRIHLLPAILVFASLCWLNCVAIEHWENSRRSTRPLVHCTTAWAADNLRLVATALACTALIFAAESFARHSALLAIYCSCVLSAGLFVVLDCSRERWSALQLRIAADAALLTPLLFLQFFT